MREHELGAYRAFRSSETYPLDDAVLDFQTKYLFEWIIAGELVFRASNLHPLPTLGHPNGVKKVEQSKYQPMNSRRPPLAFKSLALSS
jgi:hypothetical protein